jgi:hypothetical protein
VVLIILKMWNKFYHSLSSIFFRKSSVLAKGPFRRAICKKAS